jgi:hypothetical protein
MGTEEQDRFGKPGPGAHQRFQVPAFLQLPQAAEGGDHPLLDVVTEAVIFDDLQIGSRPGLFGAEEHRSAPCKTLQLLHISRSVSSTLRIIRGTTF